VFPPVAPAFALEEGSGYNMRTGIANRVIGADSEISTSGCERYSRRSNALKCEYFMWVVRAILTQKNHTGTFVSLGAKHGKRFGILNVRYATMIIKTPHPGQYERT
jgi:hypothetical protein